MIWFTSDTHFNHKNIIEYCKRPFKNVQQMNKVLIENWNKRVKKNDIIYHLGDFAFGNFEKIKKIREKLNGKIYLILGNHDIYLKIHKRKCYLSLFEEITFYKELKAYNKKFILFHYPIYEWNGFFKDNVFHLYGHNHRLNFQGLPGAMNVCVDLHKFFPISIEEVIERLEI